MCGSSQEQPELEYCLLKKFNNDHKYCYLLNTGCIHKEYMHYVFKTVKSDNFPS